MRCRTNRKAYNAKKNVFLLRKAKQECFDKLHHAEGHIGKVGHRTLRWDPGPQGRALR